mmetsp:Transcript_18491/g.27934  ORF Transcript_18491/g.27934 Transcript_18491/m.27934 type:complete len:379 (+) Transcript_18491:432-1568(+)
MALSSASERAGEEDTKALSSSPSIIASFSLCCTLWSAKAFNSSAVRSHFTVLSMPRLKDCVTSFILLLMSCCCRALSSASVRDLKDSCLLLLIPLPNSCANLFTPSPLPFNAANSSSVRDWKESWLPLLEDLLNCSMTFFKPPSPCPLKAASSASVRDWNESWLTCWAELLNCAMVLFNPPIAPFNSFSSAAVRDLMSATPEPFKPRLNSSANFLILPLFAFNASKSEAAGDLIDSEDCTLLSGEKISCFIKELRPKLANSASVRDRSASVLLLVIPRSKASAAFFILSLLLCSDLSSAVVLDLISAKLLRRGVSSPPVLSSESSLQSNACAASCKVALLLSLRAVNSAAVRDLTSSKFLLDPFVNTSDEILLLLACV